jgi:ATP phosphoribosyltransferase
MQPIRLALPSKGRLKEQAEAWLADAGFALRQVGGARSYVATLEGAAGIEPVLMSASEIAGALARAEVHAGVTGEDLIAELGLGEDGGPGLKRLRRLGFGRADLVVATPRAWLDVATVADLEALAAERYAETGQRLRVATKYMRAAAAFFARAGLIHYRLVESAGATEAAPAAGSAEAIVDITSTGATLAANGLRVLEDGLILRSEAALFASRGAGWQPGQIAALSQFLAVLEARSAAHLHSVVSLPALSEAQAVPVAAAGALRLAGGGAVRLAVARKQATRLAAELAALDPTAVVDVTEPRLLFLPGARGDELAAALGAVTPPSQGC